MFTRVPGPRRALAHAAAATTLASDAGASRSGCRCLREPRAGARGALAVTARGSVVRVARTRPAGRGMPLADALSARPRPHRALEGVPAPAPEDPGLRRPGRRPFPHAAHAH